MSTIDIRKEETEVTKIVFAEKREVWLDATHLARSNSDSGNGVVIGVEGRSDCVLLPNLESVDNLIKALQRSKKLGWV